VDVVGPAEQVAAPQYLSEATPLDDCRRDAETDECEPSDRREDVQLYERRERQEDEQAGEEGGRDPSPRHRPFGGDHRGCHVGEGDERRADGEADDLPGPSVQSRQQPAEDADRDADRESWPEMPPVEVQRLRHDLPDRPRLRRQGRRQRLLGLPGHGANRSAA
jgi:hypothetical protein